jgi:hypothetical protein
MKFRKTTNNDMPTIVEMIADDTLGRMRENFKPRFKKIQSPKV